MYVGVVTKVLVDKGYGFIRLPDSPDVFLHARDLDDSLPWDETLTERRVEFEIVTGPKGPRAANVRPAI